ncbi:zinc ABC transporter substrate-binding protein [soil metagenome]
MKFILILALALTISGLAVGCGGSDDHSSTRETVAASFYPLAFAAEQVGGEAVSVENLTPPGAEPHDLEVSPSDVSKIKSADLVLLLGHGFQPQLEDAAGSGPDVVALLDTRALDLRPDGDPHVWLDPIRYMKIVDRLGVVLRRPAAASRLLARLRKLDKDFRLGLANCARRDIVTSHEAFAYLAERYGLDQIAVTGLNPEAEPTPQALHQTVDVVRASDATTVYFERLVSPRLAETVARETGTKKAVLDPIEGLTDTERKQGTDYFTLMRANLHALQTGLGCR